MMNHPIHLHGMWSELENPDGQFQVRKHTINVQPAQRVTYAASADNLGRSAYHCPLWYHIEAGMFREVVVSSPCIVDTPQPQRPASFCCRHCCWLCRCPLQI